MSKEKCGEVVTSEGRTSRVGVDNRMTRKTNNEGNAERPNDIGWEKR